MENILAGARETPSRDQVPAMFSKSSSVNTAHRMPAHVTCEKVQLRHELLPCLYFLFLELRKILIWGAAVASCKDISRKLEDGHSSPKKGGASLGVELL